MKVGWTVRTLSEVCEFERGLTYSKNDEVEFSRNAVLRANNIDSARSQLDLRDIRYISDSVIVPTSKKVKLGSIIICTASGSKSHLGKVAFVDKPNDYAFGGFMGQITARQCVLPRYLFRALTTSSYNEFIRGLADGININNLKFDDLRRFELPVPPLPEQQRIVAILDEAFEGLALAAANAEKNLKNARDLLRVYIRSSLELMDDGWIEAELGDICELYLPRTISKSEMTVDGDYPVFGANGLIGRYHEYNHEESQLLVTCRGATCGSINVSPEKCWVTGNSMVVQPRSSAILRDFLEYTLRFYVDFSEVITGSAQPQITRQSFAPYVIRFPSSQTEQARLVDAFRSIEAGTGDLATTYQRKLQDITQLKQSLLAKAFAGDLT